MGINDLLKLYKPIIQNMNISELKGKCAGIDIMVWLYRGVYAAVNNSTQEDFSKCDIYLNFPLKILLLLKERGINCIAVFDGNNNEAKLSELKSRVDQKKLNCELALTLAKEGKEEESRKIMKRTLKIQSRMINTLIILLKKLEIPVIVAPYEADSQLAYLYKHNIIDFAISEDSDLIPYGIERIAFKLDSYGNMSYLDISTAKKVVNSIEDEGCNWLLSIPHYKLVSFCVMLGCDYLPSIKGFGTKTGMKLFRSVRDLNQVIERMRSSGKYKIDSDYLEKAKKAISVFYLQTVYEPKENKLVSLSDVQYYSENDSIDDLILKSELYDQYVKDRNYYGPCFDDYEDYCKGNVDIKTKSKDKDIESSEVIQKYFKRYAKMVKLANDDDDDRFVPFEKKADCSITATEKGILIKQSDTQSKEENKGNKGENENENEKEVIDIAKEIEYLKKEINTTYQSKRENCQNDYYDTPEKRFLNQKRYQSSNDIKNETKINEEKLLASLEKIIQEGENKKGNKKLPPTLSDNKHNDSTVDNQKNISKHQNLQWKISNNAEVKQNKNASIIDDILLSI